MEDKKCESEKHAPPKDLKIVKQDQEYKCPDCGFVTILRVGYVKIVAGEGFV